MFFVFVLFFDLRDLIKDVSVTIIPISHMDKLDSIDTSELKNMKKVKLFFYNF